MEQEVLKVLKAIHSNLYSIADSLKKLNLYSIAQSVVKLVEDTQESEEVEKADSPRKD